MMTCREATQQISEELDRALTLAERVSLNVHVTLCLPCRNFRQHAAFLRDSLRAYAGRESDDRAPSQ